MGGGVHAAPKSGQNATFPKFSLFAAAPGPRFSKPAPTSLRRFVVPVELYNGVKLKVSRSFRFAVATSRNSATNDTRIASTEAVAYIRNVHKSLGNVSEEIKRKRLSYDLL